MTVYEKLLLWGSIWGSTPASVSPATAGGQILGRPATHLPRSGAENTFPVAQLSLVLTPPRREGCQVCRVEMDLLQRAGWGLGWARSQLASEFWPAPHALPLYSFRSESVVTPSSQAPGAVLKPGKKWAAEGVLLQKLR